MVTGPSQESRESIRVGLSRISYFHNVVPAGSGICTVCRQPSPSEMCGTCALTETALDGRTCDHTFFLSYTDGWNPQGRSQSAQTMRLYKGSHPPERSVADIHLLTNIVTWIHDACIREAEGGQEWDAATYVPSRTPREGHHPIAKVTTNVARLVGDEPSENGDHRIRRRRIGVGPLDCPRTADAERFAVPDPVRRIIDGKRVLLVDDMWTTGTSLQSAAAALKLAGAASVTGLCVSRWLSWDWEPHVPLLTEVTKRAYDPFSCIAFSRCCAVPRS